MEINVLGDAPVEVQNYLMKNSAAFLAMLAALELKMEIGEVNCPNGTAYDFNQPCGNECPTRTSDKHVAISSALSDHYECPKNGYFSKISSETEGSKDFKEYCYEGETCGSSTSTVKFKQCNTKK